MRSSLMSRNVNIPIWPLELNDPKQPTAFPFNQVLLHVFSYICLASHGLCVFIDPISPHLSSIREDSSSSKSIALNFLLLSHFHVICKLNCDDLKFRQCLLAQGASNTVTLTSRIVYSVLSKLFWIVVLISIEVEVNTLISVTNKNPIVLRWEKLTRRQTIEIKPPNTVLLAWSLEAYLK